MSLENICFKEETFHRRQLHYLLLKAKSIVLVTEIDGNIIGSMIILLRKNILNARIYSFNVHPEHRRKRIASSLMETAFDILEKKGYKKITLEAGINNHIAQKLYLSKGFIVD
ncbi:MAG: GNAT family N-acetyltransferase, partial [Candidatus Methanoperedens sp.]